MLQLQELTFRLSKEVKKETDAVNGTQAKRLTKY